MKILNKFILFLVFIFCRLGIANAYDFEADGLYYTILSTSDYTCEVSGSVSDSKELLIPENVIYLGKVLKVISIGKRAFYGADYESITLPQSVTSLREESFRGSKIKNIENIEGITFFGKYSFKDCSALENLIFNQKETVVIGGGSFFGCSALEKIEIPSTVNLDDSNGMFTNEGYFESCLGLKEVIINCERLPQVSFRDCSSLTDVIIGENCISLGSSCFYNCINLVNINIPNSIIGIGSSCFRGCTSLKSIKIPECVTLKEKPKSFSSKDFLGEYMFANCTSLESVEWNANVIPLYAFMGCISLNTLTIGGKTSEIYLGSIPTSGISPEPKYTFYDSNIKYLTILPGENDIDLYFKEIGGNWSEFYNSNPGSYYKENLLQIFDKVEELSIARCIKGLTKLGDGIEYKNLKKIIFGKGCPTNISVNLGGRFNWQNLEFLRSESIEPPALNYFEISFSNDQYTTMPVEVPSQAIEEYKEAPIWKNFWNLIGVSEGLIEEIFLNLETAELNIGEIVQLVATVLPEDTTDKSLYWNSSEPNVASVSEDGLVTAISEGTAIITATCGEASASCEVIVKDDAGIESLFTNPDSKISIYSTEGILIKKDCKIEHLKTLNKGIYIIFSGKDRYKISI